jgi:deoxyribodipyrimidine photo-lyase
MREKVSIVWFRQDLRKRDHSPLTHGGEKGSLLPIYILDDCAPAPFKLGDASKIWLHHSLENLTKELEGCLNLYKGQAHEIIGDLIQRYDVQSVLWNVCYEPWHKKQELAVQHVCQNTSTEWVSFNDNYLWSPEKILKDDDTYYKVFTPYKKKCLTSPMREVVESSGSRTYVKDSKGSLGIEDLDLVPPEAWVTPLEKSWTVGEQAAHKKLENFLSHGLAGYKGGRDFPAKPHVSRLSPHLHFGEISPSQIVQALTPVMDSSVSADKEHFISEIIWREFSCYLLHHFQELPQDNFNDRFDRFGWHSHSPLFTAWTQGQTGYPFVDAGMRQLWQTGYMHNRVRMVVGSFLVKNLNIHWHQGRDWFWDCLADADLGNNSASWQWIAGCGADAAPYFRIFNPTLQGEKFDPEGEYTREFVPELAQLPHKYLFKPWTAPAEILRGAGVTLGETYPYPIVDLEKTRDEALRRYKAL